MAIAPDNRTDSSSWVKSEFVVGLETVSSDVGLEVDDLVGLALRRNPRRAHLLVSKLLGKHLPVDPRLAIAAGRLLGELVARSLKNAPDVDRSGIADWARLAVPAVRRQDPAALLAALNAASRLRCTSPVVVLGFAETATSLGHLVADQLRASCYLHSTRRLVPGVAVAGSFQEGHSHATDHLLLPIPSTLLDSERTLVLVDDELSTGKTAMATIAEAHRRRQRDRYVVAALIDLRSPVDIADMQALSVALECRIDVVSLVRGRVELPEGLTQRVSLRLREVKSTASPAGSDDALPAPAQAVRIDWPDDVPDGGRHGFTAADQSRFDAAVDFGGTELLRVVQRSLPTTGDRLKVLVVGTEEFMYLPLRLAQHLSGQPGLDVSFQSTTRSPVLAVDDPGYPIRRQFHFTDAEGDADIPRFLYNAQLPGTTPHDAPVAPDLVVVLADAAADTAELRGPQGVVASLQAAGLAAALVVLDPVEPARLGAFRQAVAFPDLPTLPQLPRIPDPLTGPRFGSYSAAEVKWLLTDLSAIKLEDDVAVREAAIQAGTAHYAESLPVEFQPDSDYQNLFFSVLEKSASRLALAVGRVTEIVLSERGPDVVLASLARAGTPIGILMRRWAKFGHGLDLPHYAISIVRGRGIDTVALQYLAAHHDSRKVVFVDGWTGKGAIALELATALNEVRVDHDLEFSGDLAVLADPGYCVRTFGTRDDFLIASACLNSTASGLVSRTVLNDRYLRPGQFHGAKFYRELTDVDVSAALLDRVTAAFPAVLDEVLAGLSELAGSDREPTFAGWKAIEQIRAEYGIESVNFVKPGVGETTRVLLRRVPWRILVRDADNPDHEHLRLLARQRNVPVEVRPDLPYSCVGLIRRLSSSEPGES